MVIIRSIITILIMYLFFKIDFCFERGSDFIVILLLAPNILAAFEIIFKNSNFLQFLTKIVIIVFVLSLLIIFVLVCSDMFLYYLKKPEFICRVGQIPLYIIFAINTLNLIFVLMDRYSLTRNIAMWMTVVYCMTIVPVIIIWSTFEIGSYNRIVSTIVILLYPLTFVFCKAIKYVFIK